MALARDHGFKVASNQLVEKTSNEVNRIMFWLEKAD